MKPNTQAADVVTAEMVDAAVTADIATYGPTCLEDDLRDTFNRERGRDISSEDISFLLNILDGYRSVRFVPQTIFAQHLPQEDHEFGAGLNPTPQAKAWMQRARMWREKYKVAAQLLNSIGMKPPCTRE